VTAESEARACPACGEASPPSAKFCASCGHPLAEDVEQVAYAQTPPRLFGVLSPTATFVLGCFLLLATLLAFLAGSWVLGILLLAASGAVFVLFYGAAERDPANPVARTMLTSKERIRGWTAFTTGSAEAWTKAGRDVVRLRAEVRALRREREQAQRALGEAAYREDEATMASLRTRMRELDEAVSERERERTATLERARHRVDDERVAVSPTQVLAPDEGEPREPAESS
jgi:hypothetical protein